MSEKKSTRRAALPLLSVFIAAAVMLVSLCQFPANAVTQSQIDKLKDERQKIQEERDAVKKEMESLESEQMSVMERKAALDEQNELTRQEIEIIDEQIDLYEKMVTAKKADADEAAAREQEQMVQYRRHMRAVEERGAIGYLDILFQARSFSELLSRIDDIRDIINADKRVEAQYTAAREEAAEAKAAYETAADEAEIARAEQLEKRKQLEADIEDACKLIAEIENDIEAHREEYEEMQNAFKEVDSEITKMLKELQRQEEERKKVTGSSGIVSTGSYIWPLPGYSAGSRTFGTQFHPILKVWKTHSGQDIGAPSGATIVAADSGTVSVASYGYNGGYGNYVMINHGGGRATLYAHMSSIAVTAGSKINQGDTVGYVGTTGMSTGPHLHFEVRVNGSAVDPMQYFS